MVFSCFARSSFILVSTTLLLVLSGLEIVKADTGIETTYTFATQKPLLRQRLLREPRHDNTLQLKPKKEDVELIQDEDQAFWDRILQDQIGSVPEAAAQTEPPNTCPTRVRHSYLAL